MSLITIVGVVVMTMLIMLFLLDQLWHLFEGVSPVFRIKRFFGQKYLSDAPACGRCEGTSWADSDGWDDASFDPCTACDGLSHECSPMLRRVFSIIAWGITITLWAIVFLFVGMIVWIEL